MKIVFLFNLIIFITLSFSCVTDSKRQKGLFATSCNTAPPVLHFDPNDFWVSYSKTWTLPIHCMWERGYHLDRTSNRGNVRNRGRGRSRGQRRNIVYNVTEPLPVQRIRLGHYGVVSNINEGLLEVYRGGTWGIVCDDNWEDVDATVACRQLGFNNGVDSSEESNTVDTGPWNSSSILMDDVNCRGNEHQLLNCRYSTIHDCSKSEAVYLKCRPNTGCDDGWVAGPNGCYKFINGIKNYGKAKHRCVKEGGHLVNIETAEENHFLSNYLSIKSAQQGSPLHQKNIWLVGAKYKKKKWIWEKTIKKQKSTKNRKPKSKRPKPTRRPRQTRRPPRQQNKNSRSRSPRLKRSGPQKKKKKSTKTIIGSMNITEFFPGWKPTNYSSEPSKGKGEFCIVLTNIYQHPNGSSVKISYFFWDNVRCKAKTGMDIICEKPLTMVTQIQQRRTVEECYTGNGASYRGTMSRTDLGTTCKPWSNSTAINNLTNPNKGLEHNFCRNPDDDARPWCWVNTDTHKYGYCSIPKCTSIQQTVAVTVPTTTQSLECPEQKFYCESDRRCIPGLFRCDAERDCTGEEDEQNCDYKLPLFQKTRNARSRGYPVEKYRNIPRETCARFCSESQNYVCRSFSYKASDRICYLSNDTSSTARIEVSLYYDYFQLMSQTVSCDNQFRCANGKCISRDLVCNGKDDCHDFSDENECDNTNSDLKIRLADGEDEHSGRVEIQYRGEWGVICDDEWDIKDANVVCKMLGYSMAKKATSLSTFGRGNGNFLLDNVRCHGDESSILECDKSKWKEHNCKPYEEAGVSCHATKACVGDEFSCQNGNCTPVTNICNGNDDCGDMSDEQNCVLKIQLVNGTSNNEGRVELIRNGISGTVCDDGWDDDDANVACKMLGYKNGGLAKTNAFYGSGTGIIWIDDVECSGNEDSLEQCRYPRWGQTNCDHSEDAGVLCLLEPVITTTSAPTRAPQADIRVELVGGSNSSHGRVELIINGERGTICNDHWDDADATVICRMLNYVSGKAITQLEFGEGSGTIWLDDVFCSGTENSIGDCLTATEHDCTHREDASVVCFNKTSTMHVEVELVDGNIPTEGRIVLIINGTRGTVCDDNFDNNAAKVICRMLGLSGGVKSDMFGEGVGNIWLDDLACTGHEPSIEDCVHSGIGVHNCEHSEDIGVICRSSATTTTTEPEVTHVTGVVLVGGQSQNEGRVELIGERGGQEVRGTICDDGWDDKDANVVCRMLGYRSGTAAAGGSFGSGEGEIWLDDVDCFGTEDDVSRCPHSGIGVHNCGHSEDAGVICTSEVTTTQEITTVSSEDVRVELVNGDGRLTGRVEVMYGGVRGTVCDDQWESKDAAVVCRMLGFRDGVATRGGAFGPGSGIIWLDNVQCTGTEDNIAECRHPGWGVEDCGHDEDAGVRCIDDTHTSEGTTPSPPVLTVELVNGGSPERGRVEIIYKGNRGTICDDHWDDNDANVICRMLGYNNGGSAVEQGRFGAGSGPIFLDNVGCTGSETSIADCKANAWNDHNCQHSEDAGVICNTSEYNNPGQPTGDVLPQDCGRRPLTRLANAKKRKKRSDRTLGEYPRVEKIIGGVNADYGWYPWQVGVRKVLTSTRTRTYHTHWCGGTILSEYWILSAAHCFQGFSKSRILLRTGDLNNKGEDDYEQEFEVELLLNHEDYDETNYDYDLALLKIKPVNGRGIIFNNYVQPACLPSDNTQYTEGTYCHISGWGKTEFGAPNMLKKAEVPIVRMNHCKILYKNAITPRMFCAGFIEGGIDTCSGDSGGPLVCEIDGKYTVLGATSWGSGCGQPNAPGVYANVRYFLPWIRDKLKIHG